MCQPLLILNLIAAQEAGLSTDVNLRAIYSVFEHHLRFAGFVCGQNVVIKPQLAGTILDDAPSLACSSVLSDPCNADAPFRVVMTFQKNPLPTQNACWSLVVTALSGEAGLLSDTDPMAVHQAFVVCEEQVLNQAVLQWGLGRPVTDFSKLAEPPVQELHKTERGPYLKFDHVNLGQFAVNFVVRLIARLSA